jgi:hypothetical protein
MTILNGNQAIPVKDVTGQLQLDKGVHSAARISCILGIRPFAEPVSSSDELTSSEF